MMSTSVIFQDCLDWCFFLYFLSSHRNFIVNYHQIAITNCRYRNHVADYNIFSKSFNLNVMMSPEPN